MKRGKKKGRKDKGIKTDEGKVERKRREGKMG